MESPRRTASSRIATLCSFDPVKCCSRLPYDSAGTTRRSKRSPSFDRTVAFVSPCAATSATHFSFVKYSVSSRGSVAVATMSRSLNVSLRRRPEPASETCTVAGCSRSTETTASTAGRPSPSSRRPSSGFSALNASALRIFSSLFAPSPASPRSCWASAAPFNSSIVVTPSSRQMRAAVFGPRPGRRMNWTTPSGTSARRLSSASIVPVSTIWTIFSSIVLPIPCSSFARPSSASCAIDPDVSRIRVAARRYARTRNDSAPSSSSRSARRSNCSASSPFPGNAATRSIICTLAPVANAPQTKATICLPTYNEAENLEKVVRALDGKGVDVLVVDDNSPDGTGEIADRLAGELDYVSVLHREQKEGIGRAYIAAFHHLLAGDSRLILEMDCDFSHDPNDVPRLIAACDAGADLALGSRYVEGGGTRNWGVVRRFISWGGSFYARVILGLSVRDLTGGFKCFRRHVLETLDLDEVDAKGYAFQIETTYRAVRRGFKVVEVPIVFSERTEGHSKMSRSIVLEAVTRVPMLRLTVR